MRLEYVARRRIIGGFIAGDSYELAGPHEQDTLGMNVSSFGTAATDGTYETDFENIVDEYSITTDHLTKDVEVPIWLMALASQADGQAFTLDLDSDIAGVVVNPIVVKLVAGQNFRPVKTIPLMRKITFRVRTV